MNQPLSANIRNLDQIRNIRCLLAWISGDKPALDLVLDEAMDDLVGLPGLLFSLIDLATRLGAAQYPDDFVEHLQATLAKRMLTSEADDGDSGGSEPW